MDKEYVKSYARKYYDSMRYDSVYSLNKLIAGLTYEARLQSEESPAKWLIEEQIVMAQEALKLKSSRPRDQKEVTNGTWFRTPKSPS